MTTEESIIEPHGGALVDRTIPEDQRGKYLATYQGTPTTELDEWGVADVECLATGIYSPLNGFMGEADYHRVVKEMRLTSGLVWSIPVTLAVEEELANQLRSGSKLTLTYKGKPLAVMDVTDVYTPDKRVEAREVYRTEDESHPGVAVIYGRGTTYVGGPIWVVGDMPHENLHQYRLTPTQTREEFKKRGWKKVVAFQTRNPIHRAHEYLQKVALEQVDGLLVNPLVGATKKGDIPADIRMQSYEIILEKYYPKDRTFLAVFPGAMRYAGPREAIMHAIARKNFGCTHFIVGRDHAGVGSYYGTYDAQNIFDQLEDGELKIQNMNFEHAFFCKKCGQMGSDKTCPHGREDRVFLSGTKVREILVEGGDLPTEFTRPEVAEILRKAYQAMED